MNTVSKGKLKAKMLEYFREVESSGEPLIVTDRGRKVLEIRPIESQIPESHEGMILQEYSVPLSSDTTLRPQEEILEELRILATPVSPISEELLMAPLPFSDWDVEGEDDKGQ